MPLFEQAAEAFTAARFLAEHHFGKRQVDEPSFGADLRSRPDRGELRRIVAEWIVRGMAPRKAWIAPLCERGINGDGQSRALVRQEADERCGVARAFDEHGLRLGLVDQPADVPGARRAVVPDREVGDSPVQLQRRNQGSHFRAFSKSVHVPPCCLLRSRTTTSK